MTITEAVSDDGSLKRESVATEGIATTYRAIVSDRVRAPTMQVSPVPRRT